MIKKEVKLRKQNKDTNFSLSLPTQISDILHLQPGMLITVFFNETTPNAPILLFPPNNALREKIEKFEVKMYLEELLKQLNSEGGSSA